MVRKKKEGIKLARPRSEVWQCVSVVYKTVLGGDAVAFSLWTIIDVFM